MRPTTQTLTVPTHVLRVRNNGTIEDVYYSVLIRSDALRHMALKAYSNKARKSTNGPLIVSILEEE